MEEWKGCRTLCDGLFACAVVQFPGRPLGGISAHQKRNIVRCSYTIPYLYMSPSLSPARSPKQARFLILVRSVNPAIPPSPGTSEFPPGNFSSGLPSGSPECGPARSEPYTGHPDSSAGIPRHHADIRSRRCPGS